LIALAWDRSKYGDLQRGERDSCASLAVQFSGANRCLLGRQCSNDIKQEASSGPNFSDWKDQAESFEAMAAFYRSTAILSGDGEPERIQGCTVTDGFFSVLKVEPALGGVFQPDEMQPARTES